MRPAYDGANAEHLDLIPMVRYYRGALFARTTEGILEGGVRFPLRKDFHVGAQLAYEEGRKADESAFLATRNVPDLSPSASVGLHAEWDTHLGPAPLAVLGRVRHDIRADRGTQTDLRATAGLYQGHGILAGAFAQITWGNDRALQTFYLEPNGGPMFTSIGLLGSYDLSRHWWAVASAELRQLRASAASSELAERRTARDLTLGAAYRF